MKKDDKTKKNLLLSDIEWAEISAKIDALGEWKKTAPKKHSQDGRNSIAMSVRDLFALGCILRLKGFERVGRISIETALQAIELDKKFIDKFVENMKGNERHYSSQIRAHCQIDDFLPEI